MILILLGPQGSGKGTQADLLAKKYNLWHLEMGRILRSVANSDNGHADTVKTALNSGNLVPDEYTRLIAWDYINKHKNKASGFIFEGYPRTVEQYEQVKDMFRQFGRRIDAVINITISEEESIKRLSARRTCIKCGEVYNLLTKPSPMGDKCECGGELVQREDDKPEAIKRRLQIYRQQTHPIYEQAAREGTGFEVEGERPIEEIFNEIVSKLEERKNRA